MSKKILKQPKTCEIDDISDISDFYATQNQNDVYLKNNFNIMKAKSSHNVNYKNRNFNKKKDIQLPFIKTSIQNKNFQRLRA